MYGMTECVKMQNIYDFLWIWERIRETREFAIKRILWGRSLRFFLLLLLSSFETRMWQWMLSMLEHSRAIIEVEFSTSKKKKILSTIRLKTNQLLLIHSYLRLSWLLKKNKQNKIKDSFQVWGLIPSWFIS